MKLDVAVPQLKQVLPVRAGVDSPTSPTLAGPYFRGALIRWAWHHRTKSDQIDGLFNYFLDGGSKENTCGKKSSCHNWELNPFLLLVKQMHKPLSHHDQW